MPRSPGTILPEGKGGWGERGIVRNGHASRGPFSRGGWAARAMVCYSRFVLCNKLRAVGQVFFRLPRIVRGVMTSPLDQIVYASADGPTIQ